jgi:RHS repeat-associated protein
MYNANNQRIVKLINNEIHEKYLWLNLTTLLAVLDKDDNIKQRYIYTNQRTPIAYTDKDNNIFYLSYNHLGSLKAITNQNNQIIKTIDDDSFGNIINDTNPNLNIPIGFAGGLYDKDTKLTKFGYREYDSYTGRWTSKDPIDFEGGDSNLYGYVMGDPVNGVDPTGEKGLNPTHPGWCVLITTYSSLDKIDKKGVCTTGISELARKDPWQITEMCNTPSISVCQIGCAANEFWEELKENCTPNPLDARQKLPKPVPKPKEK